MGRRILIMVKDNLFVS
ncbi:hypothetical protein MIMGU_mgv1a0223742mg, partial [Erythranthe guttata]